MPDASLTNRILGLAIPSLGALIAEPLFLLTDTAMVGHLGATALASLGLASTILTTVIGLLIFLAYATTPIVARRLGAGNKAGQSRRESTDSGSLSGSGSSSEFSGRPLLHGS